MIPEDIKSLYFKTGFLKPVLCTVRAASFFLRYLRIRVNVRVLQLSDIFFNMGFIYRIYFVDYASSFFYLYYKVIFFEILHIPANCWPGNSKFLRKSYIRV